MEPAWVEQVRHCDEPYLPEEVREGVLVEGSESLPHLLELLHDDDVLNEFGALHAIALLGELRDHSAIPDLVRLLVDEPGTRLAEAADEVLRVFGVAALPALLDAMKTDADCVAFTLGGCAAGLERSGEGFAEVRAALVHLLESDPAFAADCLVQLGDPEVLPSMMSALADTPIDESDGMVAGQAVVELVRAIERLGGNPGDLGRRRMREVDLVRAPMLELMSQITASRNF